MPFGWRPLVPLFVLLLLVGALPAVQATAYEGPGQQGTVPVGEGGLLVPHLKGVADDRVFVALQGIPQDACRLVLDANGTYAQSALTWTQGDAVAYVWAETGARDAPFRLHAVWTLDLNGNCTAERTEGKTYWHDPRGRPFVELSVLEDKPVYHGPAGTTIPVRFTVHNNGTLEDNVTAQMAVVKDTFQVSSGGPVVDVAVAPLEEVAFVFDVAVPRDTKPRPYAVQVNLRSDSGWGHGATAILEVHRPVGPAPSPTGSADPAGEDPLAPPTVAPQEAPLPVLLPLAAVALAAVLRRRV